MNRADSYQAGRADGERMGNADLRDHNPTRELDLRDRATLALYSRPLGAVHESEAAYWLGACRGYRHALTRCAKCYAEWTEWTR